MRELAFITAVSWLGDHRLELTFRDGVHGEIDLATDLQEFPGALARLRDVAMSTSSDRCQSVPIGTP